MEKIKVKLNFQADKPTLNGRVYPKAVLKKAFDERFTEDVFVIDSYNDGKIDFTKMIAIAKNYEIKESGEIILDIKPLETPIGKFSIGLLKEKCFEITTAGFGTVDEKTKTINDFKLSHFFIGKK